jgi:hypothetical protein
MSTARLILKQPTGWFAAGREVAQALALLSDWAFKLYIHLCLEADRHTARAVNRTHRTCSQTCGSPRRRSKPDLGRVAPLRGMRTLRGSGRNPRSLLAVSKSQARSRGQPASRVRAASARGFSEAGMCALGVHGGRRKAGAESLSVRGVSLEQLRRAIWLGCARKYVAMLNGQTRLPITSLAYFASLIDEVANPRSRELLGTCTAQNGGNGKALVTDPGARRRPRMMFPQNHHPGNDLS